MNYFENSITTNYTIDHAIDTLESLDWGLKNHIEDGTLTELGLELAIKNQLLLQDAIISARKFRDSIR